MDGGGGRTRRAGGVPHSGSKGNHFNWLGRGGRRDEQDHPVLVDTVDTVVPVFNYSTKPEARSGSSPQRGAATRHRRGPGANGWRVRPTPSRRAGDHGDGEAWWSKGRLAQTAGGGTGPVAADRRQIVRSGGACGYRRQIPRTRRSTGTPADCCAREGIERRAPGSEHGLGGDTALRRVHRVRLHPPSNAGPLPRLTNRISSSASARGTSRGWQTRSPGPPGTVGEVAAGQEGCRTCALKVFLDDSRGG